MGGGAGNSGSSQGDAHRIIRFYGYRSSEAVLQVPCRHVINVESLLDEE